MTLNRLYPYFSIIVLIELFSCSNPQAELKQVADQIYKMDSTKVFSRDLSYYDSCKPEVDYKNQYNFPSDLESWYNSLLYNMRQSKSDSIRYSILVSRLRQYPVYVEMPWGENKELKHITVPYGVFLDYQKTLPTNGNNPCDKEASSVVLSNMESLTSKIDKEAGKYYIIHDLWLTCDYEKKLKFITSVADAHACLEGKARHILFIDDFTGSKIAEASSTWGIKVLDEKIE
jgi:hypothetical protein